MMFKRKIPGCDGKDYITQSLDASLPMVREYALVVKSGRGRILANYSYDVISESGRDAADIEAMEQLGLKLVREAAVLRVRPMSEQKT